MTVSRLVLFLVVREDEGVWLNGGMSSNGSGNAQKEVFALPSLQTSFLTIFFPFLHIFQLFLTACEIYYFAFYSFRLVLLFLRDNPSPCFYEIMTISFCFGYRPL